MNVSEERQKASIQDPDYQTVFPRLTKTCNHIHRKSEKKILNFFFVQTNIKLAKTKVQHFQGRTVSGAQEGADMCRARKHTSLCYDESHITFGVHVARKPECKQ